MKLSQSQRGISLVELMVSLVIGLVLIGGALSVYINSRATYTLNETIARMQENANFALKYLERDVALAGLWGTHTETGAVDGRAASNPVPGMPGDCGGADWPIALAQYTEGTNNTRPSWACIDDTRYSDNTDVLVVRHVDPTPVAGALQDGQVYIRTSLGPRGQIFVGNDEPGGFSADARNFALQAHAYYVSDTSLSSSDTVPVPALRRVSLETNGAAAVLRDSEIVPGVENFQVQFGVRPLTAALSSGAVVYVNPDSALLANARIVSARIWVLIRAELPEVGFTDDATYAMGDINFEPAAGFLNHRRLLVTRTVDIRNRI